MRYSTPQWSLGVRVTGGHNQNGRGFETLSSTTVYMVVGVTGRTGKVVQGGWDGNEGDKERGTLRWEVF